VRRPLVFGHRGACAYRPENTLEAFALAYTQGVDAIECDIVPTKDGHLILRHENALGTTTDVASHPEFASRKRVGVIDGVELVDWFSEDFTLDEIRTLRARERLSDLRPGSVSFDGQFSIPTLEDLLASNFLNNRSVILEVKHGDYFQSIGIDVVSLVADAVLSADTAARGIHVIFEAFEADILSALRTRLSTSLPTTTEWVWLIDEDHLGGRYVSDELLADAATRFTGMSFDVNLLLGKAPAFSSADFGSPTGLTERAHDAGLKVYTWTARVEEAKHSVEEYFHHFELTGADGIFADHPDLLLNCVS